VTPQQQWGAGPPVSVGAGWLATGGREHAGCLARLLLAYVLHQARCVLGHQISYLESLGSGRRLLALGIC